MGPSLPFTCAVLLAIAVSCSATSAADGDAADAARGGAGGEVEDNAGVAGAELADGGQPTNAPRSTGGAGGVGASGTDVAGAGGVTVIACEEETRAIPYEPGLEVASESGLRVTLVEARPTPRVGNSTWTLQVVDSDGQPVVAAALKVSPFMPDHHHGSPLIPAIEERGEGSYVASPINLIMPGFWRTTVRVTTEAWTDSVVIPLCIQ